jgi:hypothetical protein
MTISAALPPYLYHGTRAIHFPSDLAMDLVPRATSGHSNWKHTAESREDAVYLTTAYPLYYAVNAGDAGDLLIFEIATARLNSAHLIADEDALAHSPDGLAPRGLSLLERTLHYRKNSHEYAASRSLVSLGTCAHLGPISRTALQRVARIHSKDIGRLILGGFDPVISPLNYTLFGHEYEQSVPWLFGDVEVCALNPRMPRPSIDVISLQGTS